MHAASRVARRPLRHALSGHKSVRFLGASPHLRQVSNFHTARLNTGAEIPLFGSGTWQDIDSQEQAVLYALKAGYRHIDTARVYETERAVGKAIRTSGVPRNEIFLTTKLWNNKHHPDDVESALNESLKDLETDYVDLFLMHWPVAWARGDALRPQDSDGNVMVEKSIHYVDTWKGMERVFNSGKAKAIGISNFNRTEIENILEHATVVPAAHQFELHPWLQQKEFVQWNSTKGIHIIQYSPLGNQNPKYQGPSEKLINDPVLVKIGQKYHKTGAQVALAWGITQGHSVIPKSKTMTRIYQNLNGDFKLTTEEMEEIRGIDRKLRFNDLSEKLGMNFFVGLDGKK